MNKYIAKKNILAEKMGTEMVLMDLDANIYFKLNVTAQWVWTQLQNPESIDSLVAKGLAVFDGATEAALRRDFAELLKALEAHHLVEGEP